MITTSIDTITNSINQYVQQAVAKTQLFWNQSVDYGTGFWNRSSDYGIRLWNKSMVCGTDLVNRSAQLCRCRQWGSLACPYDDMEKLGYDFVRFVHRTRSHNTLIALTRTNQQLVAVDQVVKRRTRPDLTGPPTTRRVTTNRKPPMTEMNHFCGMIPRSYTSTGDNWILVSGSLNNGDVFSYIQARHLSPGYQRERLMQKLVTRMLVDMERCHRRGLHHCHFDWHSVYLDDTLRPLWISAANRYCCRRSVDSDTTTSGTHNQGCVDNVTSRVVSSRYSALCRTPESVHFGEENSCEEMDAVESWVFGAALLEVLLNKSITDKKFDTSGSTSPFPVKSFRSTIRANVAVLEQELAVSDLSVECQLFIVNLLKYEPDSRMTLSEASVHPWIVLGSGLLGLAELDFRFLRASTIDNRSFARCKPVHDLRMRNATARNRARTKNDSKKSTSLKTRLLSSYWSHQVDRSIKPFSKSKWWFV